MELSELSIHIFPPLIQRISQHCGIGVALKIMAEYGNTHLYIPKTVDSSHRLFELLGPVDSQRFCRQFGNENWSHVPKGRAALHKLRLLTMQKLKDGGMDYAQIAREIGLSERRVGALIGGGRKGAAYRKKADRTHAQENMDLFGGEAD